MSFHLTVADTLHLEGNVPVSGSTLETQGHTVEVIDLGNSSDRFALFFGGSLADQRTTLIRLSDALKAAAIRVGWLQYAEEKARIAAHADTPMGLEDDQAGE